MTAPTIAEAVAAALAVVRSIHGLENNVADFPEDSAPIFPFVIGYVGEGWWEQTSATLQRGMHTIIIELHLAIGDLAMAIEEAMSYADSVPRALLADTSLGGVVSAMGRIHYIFGSLDYNDEQTIGFKWDFEVKLVE